MSVDCHHCLQGVASCLLTGTAQDRPELKEEQSGTWAELCGHPLRAANPRTGGHQPKHWQAAVFFNLERLSFLCLAFDGDLSEVAYTVGGTSLTSSCCSSSSSVASPSLRTQARPAIEFVSGEEGLRPLFHCPGIDGPCPRLRCSPVVRRTTRAVLTSSFPQGSSLWSA